MAESKRIQLETARPLQREKRSKGVVPTLRFDLPLNETTDSACPEFSYGELVKATRNEIKDGRLQTDDLYDDDDDDKLQEIARKFEEKYNPKLGKKKKKKPGMWEDYVDKGMGYDETDPFIDNEEAYDELVPSTLTTQYGGFYVNTGDLEFRNVSDIENGFDNKIRKKRRKYDIAEKDCKKRRKLPKDDFVPKKRGRKISSPLVSALPKLKKKHQPTVADMLQQRKANLQLQKQEKLQELLPIPVERNIEPEVINEAMQISPEHTTFPVIIGINSTISEAIESVVKASGEEASSNGSVGPQTGSSDGEEVAPKPPIGNIEAPKLPDKLPSDLETFIDKLKEAAYNSEEGKCKFFTDEINRMLLSVELKSQELSSAQRSTIYSHLASHLPCTKETLQKRAKKLRLDQEDGKLREPMQKLRDAIAEVMPEMLEKYSALLQATGLSDRDDIGDATEILKSDGEESEEGKDKASQISRKTFVWNDKIRKYLCDVVRIKLKCFEVSKTRIQSAEEYLRHFLVTEVKVLWPDDWMSSRILFKESSVAHAHITNKPKKPLAITKKPSLNSLPAVTITMRPAMSILNTTMLPQESDHTELVSDKYVPSQFLTACSEENAERKDVLDTGSVTVPVNCDDKPSDLSKLFTFPIKTKSEALSPKLLDDVLNTTVTDASKARTDVLLKNVVSDKSDLISLKNNSIVVGATSHKVGDKLIGSSQPLQNKQSVLTSAKVPDFSSTFNETSLASDMLARIICASLGDFPYAGSPNADNSVSKTHVIGSGVLNMKENRVISSKLPAGVPTSPMKYESGKQSKSDTKKPSHEVPPHNLVGTVGITDIDALILNARASDSNATSVLVKNKAASESVITPVNLKLKDVVPQPRQFAEAFERYNADIQPSIRKHSSKGHGIHSQNLNVSSASPTIRFSSASELPKENSNNIRTVIDSAQRVSYELSKFSTPTTSQGVVTAPYKKRNKFSQSSKTVNEQWSPYVDVGAASLLEGMKGFPFPVTLPTPPPAHCSAPHKTAVSQPQDGNFTGLFSQHSPQRTNVHSTSLLRVHQDSRNELSNHNKLVLAPLSKTDVSRRQSLIQGNWKAAPTCQTTSTASHNQYLSPSTSPISNPKSTSPNTHSSNSHHISSPIHSHSHTVTQSEKVPPAYSQNPLPLRVSPSHTQSSVHSPKTSPSNIYSQQLNQAPFPAHQSSHSVASHQLVNARNSTAPNSSHSSTTVVNTPAVPFMNSQEQQVVHPRTNL